MRRLAPRTDDYHYSNNAFPACWAKPVNSVAPPTTPSASATTRTLAMGFATAALPSAATTHPTRTRRSRSALHSVKVSESLALHSIRVTRVNTRSSCSEWFRLWFGLCFVRLSLRDRDRHDHRLFQQRERLHRHLDRSGWSGDSRHHDRYQFCR